MSGILGQRFAVVTGGNRGIGLEICRKLVAVGKPVLLAARNARSGEEAMRQLGGPGPGLKLLVLDVASSSSITTAVSILQPAEVDLLINNAGILKKGWNKDVFNETVATNFAGAVHLTQAMLDAGVLAPGAIVNMVSSGLGKREYLTDDYLAALDAVDSLQDLPGAVQFKEGSPMARTGTPAYSVSKAMLNKAVQLMTPDLQQKGVSIVATCPDWCRTDMGGQGAGRTAEQGADSVLWPVLNFEPGLNGGFFRDGSRLPW